MSVRIPAASGRHTVPLTLWLVGLLWVVGAMGCGKGEAELRPVTPTTSDAPPRPDVPDELSSDSSSGDTAMPSFTGGVPTPSGWSTLTVGMRSEAEICAAWLASAPTAATQHAPAAGCEPGEVTLDARQDAMNRLNFYRWLVGLDFAIEAPPYLEPLQRCAFYQASNGLGISHEPDPTQSCYTPEVSTMASRSNLAAGVAHASQAIDLFTSDTAHRSLVLAPGLVATAVGFFEGVTCQLVFDQNWSWTPPVHRTVAYPAPGPNPQPPTALFTVQTATGHSYDGETDVVVSRSGQPVSATVALRETAYETQVLEVALSETPELGVNYQVQVTGIATAAGREEESYAARFVSCP